MSTNQPPRVPLPFTFNRERFAVGARELLALVDAAPLVGVPRDALELLARLTEDHATSNRGAS